MIRNAESNALATVNEMTKAMPDLDAFWARHTNHIIPLPAADLLFTARFQTSLRCPAFVQILQ